MTDEAKPAITDVLNTADLFAEASEARDSARRSRGRKALALSVAVAVVWVVFVTVGGHWGRVSDRWIAALTMIFGSIVAGSTPQGGGAIAFPVFTKVLEIPATVARSFSLCIQTIGMGTAALAIVVSQRQIDWRSIRLLTPAAIAGFLVSAWLIGRPEEAFWPSTLPGPYVKVTFTIVVAAMALVVWLSSRSWVSERVDDVANDSTRATALLVGSGLAGGVASFLVGSGADVFTYLGLVALLGLSAGIGVPTSVVVMAIVSTVGFVLFGLIDGQLSIELGPRGDVVAVGGQRLDVALPGERFDLYGLWLAAAPVVGFGAPLGSWAASKVSDRTLAKIVVGLAAVEVATTAIFLDELRSDPLLAAYALIGLATFSAGLAAVFKRRHHLLAIPPVDVGATLLPRRATLDRRRRASSEGDQ
ncbi:MAG: sulfite exporter TauE/SafE family protein [Acidimicrobiia bacterium]|nr:sulfite exporter TauE/SafE family protein [Acidimicrobiia bacterium]